MAEFTGNKFCDEGEGDYYSHEYVKWLEAQLEELQEEYSLLERERNIAFNRAQDEAGIVDRWREATTYADPTTFRPVLAQLNRVYLKVVEIHGQRGDDNCWMDIDQIFIAAGLPVPDRKVGDKEAMKSNCARYIDTMCQGGEWKSYAELEAEIVELKAKVAALEQAT